MKLVKIPTTNGLYVNPTHVVYVEQKDPYENGKNKDRQRVEVCTTMYGRYRTDDVFNMTAEEVTAIINGETT
jgi:hypothetical protein